MTKLQMDRIVELVTNTETYHNDIVDHSKIFINKIKEDKKKGQPTLFDYY